MRPVANAILISLGAGGRAGRRWRRYGLRVGGAMLLCCGFAALPTQAQRSALSEQPTLRLNRGISLVGWFTWANVDRVGRYGTDPFRRQGAVTMLELDRLRALGLDFIRLPVDPGAFLSVDRRERARRFATVGTAIKMLHQAGFRVIWDYHPVAEPFPYSYNSVFAPGGRQLDAYRALLTETTRFLRRFPADRTALELINEPPLGCGPQGGNSYHTLIEAAYRAARAGNVRLPLMLEGGCFAAIDTLAAFDLTPYRADPAVLFSFHFYEPAVFAKQGEAGSKATYLPNLGALPYPAAGDGAEALTVLKDNLDAPQPAPSTAPLTLAQRDEAGALGREAVRRYVSAGVNAGWIEARFDKVAHWARAQRVSPSRIVLGEFSAMRWNRNRGARDADRARWTADVRRAAERRNFPWAYWAYFDPQNRMSLVLAPGRRLDPVTVVALDLRAPQ